MRAHRPFQAATTLQTTVYLKQGVEPARFLRWLVESGAEVESFQRARTPLDEIFIRVVRDKLMSKVWAIAKREFPGDRDPQGLPVHIVWDYHCS